MKFNQLDTQITIGSIQFMLFMGLHKFFDMLPHRTTNLHIQTFVLMHRQCIF